MVGFRSVGFDAAPGDGCRISEHLLSFREVKCLWLFQDYRNSFIKIKSCQFIKSICGLVVRTYHLYSDDLSLITKGRPDWSLFWWSLCLESMGIINFYFVSWSNRVIQEQYVMTSGVAAVASFCSCFFPKNWTWGWGQDSVFGGGACRLTCGEGCGGIRPSWTVSQQLPVGLVI